MTTSPPDTDHDADGTAPNTIINALIGAAVAIVLIFIPFSPVLGGAIAGYLEGGPNRQTTIVGALAGLFAAIPITALIVLVGALFMVAPADFPLRFLVLFLVFLIVISMYSIGLGALGGILGGYLKREI